MIRFNLLNPLHSHKCDYCDFKWTHTHRSKGNPEKHTCPSCKRMQWIKHGARIGLMARIVKNKFNERKFQHV